MSGKRDPKYMKGGDYDPVCVAIMHDKDRPKSAHELRMEREKAEAAKKKKK